MIHFLLLKHQRKFQEMGHIILRKNQGFSKKGVYHEDIA